MVSTVGVLGDIVSKGLDAERRIEDRLDKQHDALNAEGAAVSSPLAPPMARMESAITIDGIEFILTAVPAVGRALAAEDLQRAAAKLKAATELVGARWS